MNLTEREQQVIAAVAEGLTGQEIGARLRLSPKTIDIHRGNAIQKLGARNSAHAAVLWDRIEQIEPSQAQIDANFLLDLARRMRDIPAVHVDGGDIDEVKRIAYWLSARATQKNGE